MVSKVAASSRQAASGGRRRHPRPACARLRAGPLRAHRLPVREGTAEFSPFCRVCRIDGQLAAAVRFTPILIGGRGGALLLGPLAVDPAFANQGHGRGLVGHALEAARSAGIALVVLVGDEPYYARLGFRSVPRGQIALPGPVDPDRLLAAELVPGALAGYSGLVSADRAAPAT